MQRILTLRDIKRKRTIESSAAEILNLIDSAKKTNQISLMVANAITIQLHNILSIDFEDPQILENELIHFAKIIENDAQETGAESKPKIDATDVSINKYTKGELQALRDIVRKMVKTEQPIDEIPLYAGKPTHGSACAFFTKHYSKFIDKGYEVIFAKDLGTIDARLLAAIRNECRMGSTPPPLGAASDLSNALVVGRFTDGKNTDDRIAKILYSRAKHLLKTSRVQVTG